MAPGHTPGHMAYILESGGKRLAITADAANHYVWSLEYPDWEMRFDADKPTAAATRKSLFGMIAADKSLSSAITCPHRAWAMLNPRAQGSAMCPPAIS